MAVADIFPSRDERAAGARFGLDRISGRTQNGTIPAMDRRTFLAAGAAAVLQTKRASAAANVKFGLDLFSVRSQGWTPFQHLDYCAKHGIQVVHFSELRFIGSLQPENLKKVRAYAEERKIEV